MREIVSPLDGFASPFGPQRGFNPLRIFANDEPGVWFEANDANTLFTDVAGTTPVTAPGDAVALQLDKSGRGNHRTQATTAARPLYALHPVGGVRNLLQYTEEFDNAVWTKAGLTVVTNTTTAPDGSTTAEKAVVDNSTGFHRLNVAARNLQATTYTLSAYFKASEYTNAGLGLFDGATFSARATFDLNNGTASVTDGVATITDEGGGWYRCTVSGVGSSTTTPFLYVDRVFTYTGDGTSGIFIWGAQLEEGSTATNYQRVGSFLDVSEEGKARRGRLWYNGTSHFMETGTITPGTDKAQVFAGVRKLVNNDAAEVFFEASTSSQLNFGVLAILPSAFGAGLGGNARFRSGGTTKVLTENAAFVAPVTGVLTGLGDISGDLATFRINGTQVAQNTGDQGTGNYLAYPLYFGARAGAYAPFNGYEDTSIVRFGPNLDDTTISKVESYVASKTPEPTL